MTVGSIGPLPDASKEPTIKLERAGRLLGLGRSLSYESAANGTFPVPIIKVGNTYRVPTAPLLRLLDQGTLDRTA